MLATLRRNAPCALLAVAVAASLLALWPPAHLILANANLPTLFHENLGYRFFWALRLIDGAPGDFVHPGQGVLLSLIQAIYYLFGKLTGLDLFGQISLFARLTLGVAVVAMLTLTIAIALDRKLDVGLRAALVTAPLVMGLGHSTVFSYDLYPDYHAYSKVFFLLFAWRWLSHRGWQGIRSRRAACELAVLAGLLGALKVNYAIFPAVLLLASLGVTAASRPGEALRLGAVMAPTGAIVMAGLFLLHYGGDIAAVARFFVVLSTFARSLGGPSQISLDPLAGWSSDSYSNLAWLSAILAFLCLAALGTRRALPAAFALVLAGLGAAAVAMAYWRGGAASAFDGVVIVALLCVLAAATLKDHSTARHASLALAAVFVLWPASWVACHWRAYSTDNGLLPLLETAGDWQRGLFDWNLSHGLPIYVLMPSNNFPQGTIEDMMMRGMTNFGEVWYASNENPTRAARFPQFHFVSYDVQLPPQRLVFMWVTGERPFLTVDQAMLDRHKQLVERLLRGRRREECYQVRQVFTGGTVVSCVMSAPASPS
ncbi:MAG TPA: hypothetical protein VJ487_17925 [Alphaproteobacteria bacterium]|nr:hypothetical protein [Alphaproteobacteria bacterium]